MESQFCFWINFLATRSLLSSAASRKVNTRLLSNGSSISPHVLLRGMLLNPEWISFRPSRVHFESCVGLPSARGMLENLKWIVFQFLACNLNLLLEKLFRDSFSPMQHCTMESKYAVFCNRSSISPLVVLREMF